MAVPTTRPACSGQEIRPATKLPPAGRDRPRGCIAPDGGRYAAGATTGGGTELGAGAVGPRAESIGLSRSAQLAVCGGAVCGGTAREAGTIGRRRCGKGEDTGEGGGRTAAGVLRSPAPCDATGEASGAATGGAAAGIGPVEGGSGSAIGSSGVGRTSTWPKERYWMGAPPNAASAFCTSLSFSPAMPSCPYPLSEAR